MLYRYLGVMMTDREYLNQLKNIDRRIKDKLEEEQRWRDIATNTTSKLSDMKVQTSKDPDPMGTAITKAVQYQRESAELAVKLVELKNTITMQIDCIGDDTAYNILKMLFVQGKNYSQVAVELDRSYRHTVREIDVAIKKFGDKYRETYKDKDKLA